MHLHASRPLPLPASYRAFSVNANTSPFTVVHDFHNVSEGFFDVSVNFNQGNYNIFVSLWTLLIMVYLIGIQFVFKESSFAHPLFSIVLDGLSWIFWLAAFACIAAIFDGYNVGGIFGALIAFGVLEWYASLPSSPGDCYSDERRH